ncbi:hypothetical protein G6F68_015411 [Rhizopus microsporus]|nr:hypothetical protein G6F68_015411 [Rhizopus microsporus]
MPRRTPWPAPSPPLAATAPPRARPCRQTAARSSAGRSAAGGRGHHAPPLSPAPSSRRRRGRARAPGGPDAPGRLPSPPTDAAPAYVVLASALLLQGHRMHGITQPGAMVLLEEAGLADTVGTAQH